jgi:hypothetical protein
MIPYPPHSIRDHSRNERNGEGGFPHSEIAGSKFAHNSPTLIAACHVLLRLYMPRHPPDALTSRLRIHTINNRPAYRLSSSLGADDISALQQHSYVVRTQPCIHPNQPAKASPMAHTIVPRHRSKNPFTMSKKQQRITPRLTSTRVPEPVSSSLEYL